MIRYVDSAGWTWEVCELEAQGPALTFASAAERGELYFFSRVGSRKLRRYPTEWFQLARNELEALCARAEEIA